MDLLDRPAPQLTSARTRERVSVILAKFKQAPATETEMARAAAVFGTRRRYEPPMNELAAFVLGLRAADTLTA